MSRPGEFDLIEFIHRHNRVLRSDVPLGIGDDAALLSPPPDQSLVMCSDTLNEGVHFPVGTDPEAIGWKALAVNLSDLAAMGATPAWCLLNLCLPDSDPRWLERFVGGFQDLAAEHEVALVGGDTTRGPLSISVTACGFVPPRLALTRAGAQAGDDIWVSGMLGDAALALRFLLEDHDCPAGLRNALDYPDPRTALGIALRGLAHACIDVSDGVVQDLGHLCRASHVGAMIELEQLPMSPEFAATVEPYERFALQNAGDDYELCFTAPSFNRVSLEDLSKSLDIPLTRIGQCTATPGMTTTANGRTIEFGLRGHDHFDH